MYYITINVQYVRYSTGKKIKYFIVLSLLLSFIGLVSKFCRRLFVDIFPFPPSTNKLFGDWLVNRQCTPNRFLLVIIANSKRICLYLAEKEICQQKDDGKI